jgi:hypothetical protein
MSPSGPRSPASTSSGTFRRKNSRSTRTLDSDARLGRALDAFFEQRHSILAHLALHVACEFKAPLQEMHYDPTHLLFTGECEQAQTREEVIDRSNKATRRKESTVLGEGLRPRRNRRPKVSRYIGDLRSAGWLGQRPATALRVDYFLRVAQDEGNASPFAPSFNPSLANASRPAHHAICQSATPPT